MKLIALTDVHTGMLDLVGGKAAGLGELMRAGERVPDGFCLTTEAHRDGEIPTAELAEAYQALGGGAVAVRSSATAEDLPDASFAGQQDTILNVRGTDDLVEAVRRCWASLDNERARAYRHANGLAEAEVHMAVVVQRMIDARSAGVLFTANPVTGRRDQMTVDAAPGLGTAVVDGSVVPDHYILDDTPLEVHGCLHESQLETLRAAGERVQDHFGVPQDIEWAIDTDGALWLLQSRAITTLFPQPPDIGRPLPRVFLNFSPSQGLHGPVTPMGMSLLRIAASETINAFGGKVEPGGPAGFVSIAGRIYVDITAMVGNKRTRKNLPGQLELVLGPRVSAAVERLLNDPRFPARGGLPMRLVPMLKGTLRYTVPTLVGVTRALVRPAPARERAWRSADELARILGTEPDLGSSAARLRFTRGGWDAVFGRHMFQIIYPLYAGMIATQVAQRLLKGIATESELGTVLRGMPHNVTTEMDLALWKVAAQAGDHRNLLSNTPARELADRYRRGELPDFGLDAFLGRYGRRAATEVDVGVPRWAEDPEPVFAMTANYLRTTDPDQAPDRRFAAAAAEAEAMVTELSHRARRKRPLRGRLAGFMLRRARDLAGLRELVKFSWLPNLAQMRGQLLLVGAELAAHKLLERADDIMYLDHEEAAAAIAGTDQRELVTKRRAVHEREKRRRHVPDVLLSDGTDVETLIENADLEDGGLRGMAGAPGTVTGAARVILDPTGAHLDPGEILVAPSTDPGWTPLFMTAGGLVTETGGPNAHGPTVAREYGIPAVIGVPAATQHVQTGQVITVDGSAGTVRW